MSEKYHYEPGAKHFDHHKEINIGSVSEKSLRSIISAFFSDEGEEADVVEEVKDAGKRGRPRKTGRAVKKSFVYRALTDDGLPPTHSRRIS